MKIQINNNTGLRITTSCGVVFSLQFGRNNYCENYDKPDYDGFYESRDCEVMVMNDKGTKHYFPDSEGGVTAHSDLKEVLELILKKERSNE